MPKSFGGAHFKRTTYRVELRDGTVDLAAEYGQESSVAVTGRKGLGRRSATTPIRRGANTGQVAHQRRSGRENETPEKSLQRTRHREAGAEPLRPAGPIHRPINLALPRPTVDTFRKFDS